MFHEQKPNDRRAIQGVINRLAKERKKVERLAEKYQAESPAQYVSLETWALDVAAKLEATPSKFINYKTANKALRNG